MINRRHIRVKVMQSVYAMIQSHNDDIVKEEKFLKHSIQKMFDLYVLLLYLMVEVQKHAEQKIEISKKKYLATKEDLSPNTKFINNRLIKKIAESSSVALHLEAKKLNNWSMDDEYVKIMWDQLQKSDLYRRYLNTVEDSYKVDKSFVIDFYKEIIAPNEKLAEYFEDTNITWVDDIPFVNTWVVRSLNKQNTNGPFMLGSLYKNSDDEEFVSELYKKVMLHHHTFEDDIKNHTPNWESDRIADIDMILIKMGICEFLHFPSIPTRVTINEYIEVAKDYSTQKSGYFVNGVLDKLSKEYTESKRLVKVGRGLL
ncbi:transcription antitermination factor NusB [Pseudotenacibaculum sp. MALMAid0570]|uniref:transcription antitermination factor NusB n=1 Tax=Pseudotenacibaculum sp. MALMAid0570 TaxID=3143938 RepID=UPI0032DFA90F